MPPLRPSKSSLVAAGLGALIALTTLGCLESTADRPSADDCQRMRAHVVDLQIARESKPGDKSRAAALAQHRRIRLAANQSGAIARCQRSMSPAHVSCVLAADSLKSYRACLGK